MADDQEDHRMSPSGFGSISRGEFYRALLEEFNKLSPEEQDRLLARKTEPTSRLVREARKLRLRGAK